MLTGELSVTNLWCLIKPPTISVICPKTNELTIFQTANHQRHLPENNRTKRIDLFWAELQG
jgi:hypothetical protein